MEWTEQPMVPVVLNSARPARNRHRLNSEHPNNQVFYVNDPNTLLVPTVSAGGSGRVRSSSVSLGYPSGTVVINNEQHQERSPSRERRRSSHAHESSSESERSDHRSRRRDRRRSSHAHGHGHSHAHSHSHTRHGRGHSHSRSRSSTPSPQYDSETEKRLRKLKELEKREEEEAARERYEEEMILKEARKAKKKKEEEELKKKTIEEYETKKIEEKAKAEEKKRKEDEEFRERTVKMFTQAGYSEESVEKMMKKAEKKGGKGKELMQVTDLARPTYIKVHSKHLAPETLEKYGLPWAWDERDTRYIIIKRWIPEHEQDILFEHTAKLRETKLLTDTSVELKKERDNLLLVRKKRSPSRARSKSRPRSWLLT